MVQGLVLVVLVNPFIHKLFVVVEVFMCFSERLTFIESHRKKERCEVGWLRFVVCH